MLAAPIFAAHAADRLVTVNGEATVAVAPDTAVIRIGVSSQGKTAREAGDANAKDMTAVLAALKDAGIAQRDVQTSRQDDKSGCTDGVPQRSPNRGPKIALGSRLSWRQFPPRRLALRFRHMVAGP